MQDFKVPTVQLATELHCVDGAVLRGNVYMAALSAVHAGPMLPQEWINSPPAFFPFRQESGTTLLVNKHQVLAMSVEAPPPATRSGSRQPRSAARWWKPGGSGSRATSRSTCPRTSGGWWTT